MVPSLMKSVNNTAIGKAEIQMVPLPKIADDRILVRVTAVGLNPTDWKHLEFTPVFGLRSGCDYAGVVEDVGPNVTKVFKKGDRITGVTHGSNMSNPADGAFAEFIAVKGDLQIKIPDNVSDEQAATLGVGISTVVSLSRTANIPWAEHEDADHHASGSRAVPGSWAFTAWQSLQLAGFSLDLRWFHVDSDVGNSICQTVWMSHCSNLQAPFL
jgi:NADPH:quinone reductase-like Zn-dependent oxidoreductase